MIRKSALRGYILEEILAWLLRSSAYELLVSADQDPAELVPHGNELRVRGRGITHQVDVLGEFAYTPVFSLPVRLFHKAKGLEWAAVFVPSLTTSRFPSSRNGRPRDWLVPRHLFSPERYEGSDADERRLFYVAMTRARDWLSLSRHERITRNRVGALPYHQKVTGHAAGPPLPLPPIQTSLNVTPADPVTLTFSELATY